MNMPLVLLNRRRRGGSFSPYSLFSGTAIGIWLDPSDVANLTWRRNLLTYSESFDNAAWTKTRTTISANAITAPDGTSTADKLVEDTSTNDHWVGLGPDDVAGAAYTASVFAKAGERGFVALSWQFESPTFFNLTTGAIGTQNPNYTASIVPLSDGWFRCSITRTAVSTSDFLKISVRNADGVASYTGDGTSGIYIWGAQFEAGSLTDYQRISDVNTEVIERFPTATMYQDAAGTTAVTTPGQPVGLRLDKSKGLALGADVVVNGTFDTDISGWTNSSPGTGAISWLAGAILVERTSGGVTAYQAVPCVSGRFYRVDFSFTSVVSGLPRITASNNVGVPGSGTTNILSGPFYFEATNATMYIHLGLNTGNGTSGTYDNISVKELPGNHATQSVLASRPVYGIEPAGGRRNLLTQTEAFNEAAWSKFNSPTILQDNIAAPNGTVTADRVTATSTTKSTIFQSSTTSGIAARHSIYAKFGTARFLFMEPAGAAPSVWFDLQSGIVSSNTSGGTASITSVGDGWYLCAVAVASSNGNFSFGFTDTSGAASQTVGQYSWVWGAQLELGSTATNYQRVTSAFDITEAGVQTCHYVQYDGSDDGMITNSIDFTATDKMSVFAGVRKNNNGESSILELSSAWFSNNGTFSLQSSLGTAANYYFGSYGTAFGEVTSPLNFNAPVTNVVTGLGDISGDRATLRANGTQVGQATTNQGTGNYGNYPLYLGRRGGVGFGFNGRDYGIVVVGKATTAAEITSTEKYMAGKTGVTLP